MKGRLYGLDALRGVAALVVLAAHTIDLLPFGKAISGTVDLGTVGVTLFFLISGFVIPFSFNRGLIGFAVSRAFRLLPVLWLSMALCLVLGAELTSGRQLFANAFMVTRAMGEANLSGPYWSLNWELYFYGLVAAAFAVRVLKSPVTFGLLSIAGAFGSFFDHWITYLLFMFTGTLLRMVLLEKIESAKVWLCVALGSTFGAVAVWVIFASQPPQFYVSLGLALPVFLLLWNRKPHPFLLWAGAISYPLYLFHYPILEAIEPLPGPVFACLAIALPLAIAALVHKWVEKPMIALGKTLPGNARVRTEQALGSVALGRGQKAVDKQ
jgi:peptidoglycan/LPS O-acetylase OafA/YrhL